MESYRFKNNDLFHGIGFNYYTLESILKYGILSKKEAVKENIPLAKNYDGYNMDDTISLVNTAYTNIDDLGSAYHAFIENGISFLVDRKIEYIYDKNKRYINRPDEVLALDKIDTTCLKKIIIPEKNAYSLVGSTKIIPNTSYNYFNIKDITLNYVNFIEKKIPVDLEYASELLYELKTTVNAIRAEVKKSKFPSEKDDKEISEKINNFLFYQKNVNDLRENNPDVDDLFSDFDEVRDELNDYLGDLSQKYADSLIGKNNSTILDYVSYVNRNTLNLDILLLEERKRRELR